ncbi:MAG: SIMPL domain-containing protein [Gammaproteobacteria bacterium]|nr:SIMPL domain-containing protein [Gammaproteobacteria bacterium]NNM21331.1 SIMPL domain-containing protein [Gammaproteobacteria bacterium]
MSEQQARTVTVSGNGEVSVEPDRAQVNLSVMIRSDQQQSAQREVDDTVEAVLRLTDKLGIPRKDVRTTRLNINPEFRWDKNTNERKISGYMVQRTVEINLKDLEKLGDLMHRATQAGVNQVSAPALGAEDEDKHRRDALAKAAEDARLNAETLARTLGAKLGKVRRITSSDVIHQPPVPMPRMESRAMMADAGGAAETYTPGEIKFSAGVTVEFDLEVR